MHRKGATAGWKVTNSARLLPRRVRDFSKFFSQGVPDTVIFSRPNGKTLELYLELVVGETSLPAKMLNQSPLDLKSWNYLSTLRKVVLKPWHTLNYIKYIKIHVIVWINCGEPARGNNKKKKKDYGFKHKFAIKGCRPLKEKEWWSNWRRLKTSISQIREIGWSVTNQPSPLPSVVRCYKT